MTLSIADLLVFLCYFAAILTIGLVVAKREKKTADDYFLAGRSLPWYVIGFSMIAASISVEQFLGEVGYAYRYGMAVGNWEWGVMPAFTLMVCIFVPYYLRNQIRTIPQFLENRFGPGCRTMFAVLSVVVFGLINLPGVLYGSGLALNAIFGINIYTGIAILATAAAVYVIAGGLASVAWTDVLQASLLLGSGLLVFFLGVKEVGSWQEIVGVGDRSHLMLPASHPDLPWTGMVVLFLSTNIWYYATNQYINQKVLGAKSEWDAKMGMIFTAFLGIPLTLAVCFPGFIAYSIFPNLENPDQAYTKIVNHLVGPLGYGIRGLVFAGLCGAIMSTIAALINSTSTILTLDFYQRIFNKRASQQQLIRFGRVSAGVAIVVAALWTPVVASWGSLFTYFQEFYTFMAVPTVTVFIAGLFWKRSNNFAAFMTLLLGIPIFFFPYILHQWVEPYAEAHQWSFNLNTYNLAGILYIPVVLFHIIMAYLSPAPEKEMVDRLSWNIKMIRLPEKEKGIYPWYKSLILWWAVVTAMFVGIYIVFW